MKRRKRGERIAEEIRHLPTLDGVVVGFRAGPSLLRWLAAAATELEESDAESVCYLELTEGGPGGAPIRVALIRNEEDTAGFVWIKDEDLPDQGVEPWREMFERERDLVQGTYFE